jgi:hypothetical protein
MALSEEEIVKIAQNKAKCVFAGIAFGRNTEHTKQPGVVIAPVNVSGMVRVEDLKVPHSELAMHVGAAGKELLAWSLTEDGRYAHIVYDDDGSCGYTHGLPTEVMTNSLVRVTRDLVHLLPED